jgi:hypothetical protein
VFIMRGAGIADELLTASIQYIINVAMVSKPFTRKEESSSN